LIPSAWQDAARAVRDAARAPWWMAFLLAGCSGIAVAPDAAPASSPDPSYNQLIVNHLQSFKDYASYDAFEISDFRWVHSIKGWGWLVCVRFQDRGRVRSYALYIKEKAVVIGRYAVETDGCDGRDYSPFELTNKPARPMSPGVPINPGLEPLY